MSDDTRYTILRDVVKRVRCKSGWHFQLTVTGQPDDLTLYPVDFPAHCVLEIVVAGEDSRNQGQRLTVIHSFPVPYASYNERSWMRWVFECCRKIELHELGEWFRIDDERPYAPLHGPGEDPYTFHEFRDAVDARTNQDGSVKAEISVTGRRTG
jgi:hypothetical protein